MAEAVDAPEHLSDNREQTREVRGDETVAPLMMPLRKAPEKNREAAIRALVATPFGIFHREKHPALAGFSERERRSIVRQAVRRYTVLAAEYRATGRWPALKAGRAPAKQSTAGCAG